MRQKLPLSRGYELLVNDLGRTISPGEVFDAPLLVPGCEPVEDGGGTEDGTGGDQNDADSPAEAAPPGEPQEDVGAAEAPSEPQSKARAKGTRA